MWRARVLACVLLAATPASLTRHDEDFAFDNSDELQVDLTANHSEIAKNGLRRLWGVPDTTAYVGHLFRMEIPKEAFSGPVSSYKVRSADGRRTPGWLVVDARHGLLSGVPLPADVGAHALTVTAHAPTDGLTATDSFIVQVKEASSKRQPHSCRQGEPALTLAILLDVAFPRLDAKRRSRALMDMASFMAVDGSELWMEPYKAVPGQRVLLSGPGDSINQHSSGVTAIYLNVGCGEKVWRGYSVLVSGARQQARDGAWATRARAPVRGWRLLAQPLLSPRTRRQLEVSEEGSGDEYGDADDVEYSGYDDDDDYSRADNDLDTISAASGPPEESSHPHRHHHGEPPAPPAPDLRPPAPPTLPAADVTVLADVTTADVTVTADESLALDVGPTDVDTTTHAAAVEILPIDEGHQVKIEPVESSAASNDINRFVSRKLSPLDTVPSTTTEDMQTVIIRASNETPSSPATAYRPAVTTYRPPFTSSSPEVEMTSTESVTPTTATVRTTASTTESVVAITAPTSTTRTTVRSTTPEVTSPTTVKQLPPATTPLPATATAPPSTFTPETTIDDFSEQEENVFSVSSERSNTITGVTTETVPFTMPIMNSRPVLKHHMSKMAVTAGKAFRYIIPSGLFVDVEDGSNLTYSLQEAEDVPLTYDSWLQFIPDKREVYGLPLESHVSRWNFVVKAKDSGNESAEGPLDITVQQHKGRRTVNHQFTMQLKLKHNFEHAIDWQIRALEGIMNLFNNTDMDHLTVLNATQSDGEATIVWTNDTLPKDVCPNDELKKLMKMLESSSSDGSPSAGLSRAMSPELSVVRVSSAAVGACSPRTPTRAPDTYPPVTRNQVDHITATVGQLLLYRIPEDTFFDPEDGSTRHLRLSLRYSDRSPLPAQHWLHFDTNNQELYGVPAPTDVAATQYQLVAEDSSKKTAYDSLIVEVVKPAPIRPTVEFHMQLEIPFQSLAYDANVKREVVENIARMFNDKNTDYIRVQNITDNPTTVVWYNTSLPRDICPKEEIEALRNVVISDDRSGRATLNHIVDEVFNKTIKVMYIRLIYLGLCADQNTKVTKVTRPETTHNKEAEASEDKVSMEYLVTFIIPVVVIVCMILVAGVIAIVLYRRRKTGKMSVGDEEERQAFRSKGIPVIFQDELEEQAGAAEPLHKSPVIMREEKPPLLPPAPQYRAAAYRAPPPPRAAAPPAHRPKPTPNYRKPPPYVPP